ncbi:hypothetical protein LTR47_010671 [Exophiala xenobiotica]|nr:hypothetical protein LTR47_010671 [Exophiala xenobiotica]KAK5242707.1 hypothetical protein LTS06_011344 [Exophiala xenobiotica]KAK5321279.1 hypothetical protein LTR93_006522 [Exophiala xenobiotica]KAK5348533.1 hypothetical protein LTR61_007993 [Exophiala xenobiotica]KAK5366135.1 hypothetical protein LTR11_008177 [Exophiala xenobiotica]
MTFHEHPSPDVLEALPISIPSPIRNHYHHHTTQIQNPTHSSSVACLLSSPDLNTASTARLARSALRNGRWRTSAPIEEILTLHDSQNLDDGRVLDQMLRDVEWEIWLLSDVLNRFRIVVPDGIVELVAGVDGGTLADWASEGGDKEGDDGEKDGETHGGFCCCWWSTRCCQVIVKERDVLKKDGGKKEGKGRFIYLFFLSHDLQVLKSSKGRA